MVHSVAAIIIQKSNFATPCKSLLSKQHTAILLADPFGFEDPPSGFSIVEQTHRWLAMLAVTACFICSMCPALSPATPSNLLHVLVPPLALQTPLLPQAVWLAHLRLSLPSSLIPRICPPSCLLGYSFPVVVALRVWYSRPDQC
jgi:hypothetical protein